MTVEPITSREAAVRLIAWCEVRHWRLSLDRKGRMTAIIGEATSEMPQSMILAALGALEADVVAVLRGLKRVH